MDMLNQVSRTQLSHIALCSGEAGIGKSRLVAEFQKYISTQPVNMVQGTCASYMRITPYRVVGDILRNMLSISESDPSKSRVKGYANALEQLIWIAMMFSPFCCKSLELLHSDPVMEVRIKLLEPSMLRRQTHFALRMFFLAESRKSPLVLFFDDLHWVDQASGEFLEYICQSVDRFRFCWSWWRAILENMGLHNRSGLLPLNTPVSRLN